MLSWKPFAIEKEIKRIKSLLEGSNKTVLYKIEKSCELDGYKDAYMAMGRTDINAILCLACPCGEIGITKTVGKSVPVKQSAEITGLIQPFMN